MNYVIAKIFDKEEEIYRNILSGENLYDIPSTLDDALGYSNETLLGDEEWFKVEKFSECEYFLEILGRKIRTTDYDSIHMNEIERIDYLCSVEDDIYCFQRIFKHNLLQRKYISLGDNISLKKDAPCLVINKIPDAIYMQKRDTLYFKKIQTISPIFAGIYSLYKEATKEETEQFLQEDFIETVNDYNVNKVGTMNRKRIAMVMETLKKYGKKERKRLLDYTHDYYPDLEYENGKFSVGNETDMKYLLWGIEQRYYTTPIEKEKRVANSIVVLG